MIPVFATLLVTITTESIAEAPLIPHYDFKYIDLEYIIEKMEEPIALEPVVVNVGKPEVMILEAKSVEDINKEEEEFKLESEVNWIDFKMTHYTATCKGCSGFTYTEYDVRNTIYYDNYRVLAADPKIIKEGSIVEIADGDVKFEAIAIDRGGAIKGNKLDLLVGSVKEAYAEGRKNIKLRVVRDGWLEGKRP